MITQQEFIERHRQVCQRKPRNKKYLNPKPAGQHKGHGKWRYGGSISKGSCGKRLYERCIEFGVDPTNVLHNSDLLKATEPTQTKGD